MDRSANSRVILVGGSDFILEEIEAYLKDESISSEIDHADCDPEVYICLIEKLLNDGPFQLPPMDLKQGGAAKEKSSIEEPPELELKDLPSHLEYAYLEEVDKLPVSPIHCVPKKGGITVVENENNELITTRLVIGWRVCIDYRKLNDATHKNHFPLPFMDQMLERLAGNEFYCFLDGFSGYFQIPINPPDQEKTTFTCPYGTFAYRRMPFGLCNAPGGITVVENENNELIPTRLVTGWCVCIDYRKLNDATCKDHFPLPFMDQMLKRLARNEFCCFLDGFFGYFQILINPPDQEKTTFTCPYGTFAYRRMPFGLCNAPGTFQRCMMAIFHDMIEKTMEVFMDDFWVDRAKVDVIAKLPHPTTVKGVRSFLGHSGFYRRFIQDFSKIARPMTRLLEKETPFVCSKDCIDAFEILKKKLTEAPLVIPDWNLPFELMCDASDFAIGSVLGQ
nr:hypothetical protein [Tanacetum cinerariifolium]